MLLTFILKIAFLPVLTISKPADLRPSPIAFVPSNFKSLINADSSRESQLGSILEKARTFFAENSKNHFRAHRDYKHIELPPIGHNYNNPFAFNLTNDGSGNYYSSIETGEYDRAEQGFLKNAGTDNEVQVIKGQYQEKVTDKLGIQRTRIIGYIADENGYQPFVVNSTVDTTPLPAGSPPGAPQGTGIGSGCFEAACQFG